MLRIAAALLFTVAFSPSLRSQEGRVEAGLAYARAVCSECHAIRDDNSLSPNRKAPPFAKIADTAGMTGAALNVILQTPHRDMPNLIIPAQDRADVVAYILSLQR